jgi:hypothetical protein
MEARVSGFVTPEGVTLRIGRGSTHSGSPPSAHPPGAKGTL